MVLAKWYTFHLSKQHLCALLAHVQVRLETMEQVIAKAQEPDAEALAPLLTQGMGHFPGWEEKNFQVKIGGCYARVKQVVQVQCVPGAVMQE